VKLAISDRALKHLDCIHAFLSERNANAADAEITAMLDLLEHQILKFPKMGRVGRRKGTREFPHPPYLIVYRVQGELLTVVAVFDGRRNIGVGYT
jgi:plasmid stabilization system protein ParE